MAIIPLSRDNLDSVTLELNPRRNFSSSSLGLSGSVYVFAEHSPFSKEMTKLAPFNDQKADASSLEEYRKGIFGNISLEGIAAQGAITGSDYSAVTTGMTLTMTDAAGTVYSAQAIGSGYTPATSTADRIGTDSMADNEDLAIAIAESLDQARQYGITAPRNIANGSELLRIEKPVRSGAKIFLKLLDTGYSGNQDIGGTLVSGAPLTVENMAGGTGPDISSQFDEYFNRVTNTEVSRRTWKQMEILRFEPSNTFTSDTIRKVVITDVLFPFYRTTYTTTQFAYGNYHSINFFTGAMVPTCSALIYPSPLTESNDPTTGLDDEPWDYNVYTGFTFAFQVNPRRTIPNTLAEYHASTVMHMSSCYAISIVTGSNRNAAGYPENFRVMLQLSHSADVPPSKVNLPSVDAGTNNYPNDLIFLSQPQLTLNCWNHIAITWGALHNDHTGSFWFDGVEEETTKFIVPSASINTGSTALMSPYVFNPLFVGNFYDGPAVIDLSPDPDIGVKGFFNPGVAAIEGVYNYGIDMLEPSPGTLSHPCNVELADIRIYGDVVPRDIISSASYQGPDNLSGSLKFYLPPFFTKDSPKRKILQTPFQSTQRTTDTPFNVELSFGVDGRDINLQNYCREFRRANYPRLFFLTASTIDTSTGTYTADQFLWESASFAPMVRARNLLIYPNDNAKFTPNFDLLKSGTVADPPISGSEVSRFVNDSGRLDLTLINLRELVPTGSIFKGLTQTNADGTDNTQSTGILQSIVGSSPESPGVSPGSGLTILQRTRDASSNAIVVFDASNLFYGMSIKPGTVTVIDNNITGSGGELSMTLKDNFQGNLYRADSTTENCKWNAVGNVLYEEGIFIIKAPTIPFMGKNSYDIEFEGIQNIHVLEVNVPAAAGQINSSSNPSFNDNIKPNDFASTTDNTFVGISGVLLHDENMNVIARTNLAQPITKVQADKFLFRIKIDF